MYYPKFWINEGKSGPKVLKYLSKINYKCKSGYKKIKYGGWKTVSSSLQKIKKTSK